MNRKAKLDYGDEVQILDGVNKGRTGVVVGMNHPEFGDGSDGEVPLGFLGKRPESVATLCASGSECVTA